eukprot:scaffold6091_cov112-Isochrysis_galbana.AAC.4
MQAVARAGNHTCIELSSALSTRTRFGWALLRGHVHLLQLQKEQSGRHCCPPRARGVLFRMNRSRRRPSPLALAWAWASHTGSHVLTLTLSH